MAGRPGGAAFIDSAFSYAWQPRLRPNWLKPWPADP
jgi:hypothetical protein